MCMPHSVHCFPSHLRYLSILSLCGLCEVYTDHVENREIQEKMLRCSFHPSMKFEEDTAVGNALIIAHMPEMLSRVRD